MTTAPKAFDPRILIPDTPRRGPVTGARRRRALAVYGVLVVAGSALVAFAPSAGWQAFGAGLWWPGAGFVAAGGWPVALTVVSLVLFAASLVAWFGSGMTIAPPLVWLVSAVVAGLLAGESVWWPGVIAAAALLVVVGFLGAVKGRRAEAERARTRERRNTYLPTAATEVLERRQAAPRSEYREMDDAQLGWLRYCLDLARQPHGQLEGFNRIDQFQTSALRYQVNQLGYTLSLAQARFTPNFHGYLSAGQRCLIEQYLHRQIWTYWRLENAWGNLSLNPDPAVKDNIMLTGFYGLQVALYAGNTGDRRYTEPGGLTFVLDEKRKYPHSLTSVIDNIMNNFRDQAFMLYPCEPNWIYTGCNFRGINAVGAHDRAYGTRYVEEIQDGFRRRLEQEFTTTDGGVVALRSAYTGFAVPFPVPDATAVTSLGPIWPDLAARYWAIVRTEEVTERDGEVHLDVPKGVDFGNYKPSEIGPRSLVFQAAREIGDHEVADVLDRQMVESGELVDEEGRRFFRGTSVLTNSTLAQAHLMDTGSWAETVRTPLPPSAFTGPLLDEVPYPEVLVAHATSGGDDLRLVLTPGAGGGVFALGIRRLEPGHRYRWDAGAGGAADVVADADGAATVEIRLYERTSATLRPA